jgi:hypothetical protein
MVIDSNYSHPLLKMKNKKFFLLRKGKLYKFKVYIKDHILGDIVIHL